MKRDEADGSPVITQAGFQFLLLDTAAQVKNNFIPDIPALLKVTKMFVVEIGLVFHPPVSGYC